MNTIYKKGDIICLKRSVDLRYKTYYIVQYVEGESIYYTRCSINAPASYLYKAKRTDVVRMNKIVIDNVTYIHKQLLDHHVEISNDDPFHLHLKKTEQSLKLLKEDFQIIAFIKKDQRSLIYTMFEMLGKSKDIFLPEGYRIKDKTVYRWIDIIVGRKFQRSCLLTKH